MKRAELAKVIADKTGLTLNKAEKLISAFSETVESVLNKGEKVVYSNFGTFYTVHYPSKVIYHPVLGQKKKMVMLPTNAVKWMPSGNIKAMVDTGGEIDSATTFGATKELKAKRKLEGISDRKAIELDEVNFETKTSDQNDEDEEVSIPIKVARKNVPVATDEMLSPGTRVSLKGAGIFENSHNKTSQPQPQEQENKTQEISPESGYHEINIDGKNDQSLIEDKNTILNEEDGDLPEISPLFSLTNKKNDITFIDLSKTTVTKEILQKIPENIAREYKIIPVEETENEMVIAMVDPEDIEAMEIAKKIISKKIVPRLATQSDINHILDQYQGFESEVQDAIDDVTKETRQKNIESTETLIAEASDTAPAARIVGSLLKRAIRDKASDIHIEPTDLEVIVRFRIDGVLHKKVSLPKDIQNAIISRIKILSDLKIDEQRLPQDGRFSMKIDNRKIDFRVSTMPVADGEKVVMRVLDKQTGIISLNDLGFRERDFNVINKACEKSHGLILVTGPTGSGKTTTLYALIEKIYSEGINIITLEDPIEYQMAGINQSQVNSEIDYTFASGLRSILRQDPDVVMIGEIRDAETAEMAVHAALTGHVVLSTLHTNDAAGAIPRLVDMKIEPFLLNSSINLVIGQRLARKVCDSCKEKISLSKNEMKDIQAEIDKIPADIKKGIDSKKIQFFRGKGCKNCGQTGYRGRIGLYEVLEINGEIKELIAKRSESNFIKENSVNHGMTTMIQDGIIKAIQGMTTIEEVFRVTKE